MESINNTVSVRFHLDERADVVEEINNDLLQQELVEIKASKSHVPLVTALRQTVENEKIDSVIETLCFSLEKIANGIEDFEVKFTGIGTFYHSGGKRDNCVVFLEPNVTPEMRKIHEKIHSILSVALKKTNANIDIYTTPELYAPHLTIAKRVRREHFTEVISQVNQWALDGPFDIPDGEKKLMASRVTCLALKVKNYKNTGESKIYEFNLKRT